MIDSKEVPISVRVQYLTALKYATNKTKRLEVLMKEGVNHPNIEDKNNDEETNERIIGWLHGSHLTDNKLLSNSINIVTVDIGKNKDWSITNYEQTRQTTIDGKEYLTQITNMYYNNDKSIGTDKTLKISMTKNGEEYSINSLASEQKKVILAVIDTIIKFLRNEESYIPFRATVVGCGGTGKSYIINTILTIVRKMTKRNTTILVGAPSGAAAYNVQGSTLHHLLGIGVLRPEDNITQKVKDKLLDQLKNPLCLFIDERSMLSSKVLGAAERNIQQTVYNGQNSQEIWGVRTSSNPFWR